MSQHKTELEDATAQRPVNNKSDGATEEELAWGAMELEQSAGGGVQTVKAVRIIQKWWLKYLRVAKAAAALTAQAEKLQVAAEVLSGDSSGGFEDVLTKIQSRALINSVVGLLAAVSGPEFGSAPMSPRGVKSSPRAQEVAQQQQARKFLTALMIKHHPEEVITDDDGASSLESVEARLLCFAAQLALVSAVALIHSLGNLQAQRQHSFAVFRLRLNTFIFVRFFLNESLRVMQAKRATGVAVSFLSSYGEAYRYLKDAERSHEQVLIMAARQSLDKVKMGIVKVLGKEKTEKHCLCVERALDSKEPYAVLSPGDIKVPLPIIATSPPRRAANDRGSSGGRSSSSGSSSSNDNNNNNNMDSMHSSSSSSSSGSSSNNSSRSSSRSNSPAGPAAAAPDPGAQAGAAAEAVPVPQSLSKLLRNEHLAHEILIDPDFKIQEAQPPRDGPLALQLAQVREAMEKMFWDRLVLALTPAEQEGPQDFVVGALVQLRYGGPQGSLFAAKVDAVHTEDETLDVTYLMDGVKERRPLADFRTKKDPLDFEPLLALFDDVREKLSELTPKRKDLAAELQAKLDTELLGQMARRGLLDAVTVRVLLNFIVLHLMSLQAPARAEEMKNWFAGIEAQVQAAVAGSGVSGTGAAGGEGASMSQAFVHLLPPVFQTIFERIDETRRDIANAHVEMLRPFLAQHGVPYERQKFIQRLQAGEVKLVNTKAWLHAILASPEKAAQLPALAQGHAEAHRTTLIEGVSYLMRQPVRLDNPTTAKLPETLFYDARRLASLRDELDRLTLIAVYSTLLRQFLSNQHLPAVKSAGDILAALETRLYTILQDNEEVKLPHLVDEAVQSGKRVFEAAGTSMTNEQAAMLRGLLNSTVSMDNPLFGLIFTRLAETLAVYMRGDDAAAAALVGRYGFRPFKTQLSTAGRGLRRVLDHSLAVHGEIYSQLIREEASSLLISTGSLGVYGSSATNSSTKLPP